MGWSRGGGVGSGANSSDQCGYDSFRRLVGQGTEFFVRSVLDGVRDEDGRRIGAQGAGLGHATIFELGGGDVDSRNTSAF